MAISIPRINDQIIKISKGLGYEVRLFDEMGNGPISSAKTARYIYLDPDGIQISMPSESIDDYDDIKIYIGHNKDNNRFSDLLNRIRIIAKQNAIGVTTVDEYQLDRVPVNHLHHEVQARKEDQAAEE